MKGAVMKWRELLASNASPAVILIRFIVGGVFLSEGIQKFLFNLAWVALGGAAIGLIMPALGSGGR
jgi:hypothetical protein